MIAFNKKGFTLVELLVVVSIMAILGVIFTNILIDTLRGRNKVNAINQVKQNGQVVLDKLSNEIRSAEKVVCVDNFDVSPGIIKNTMVIFNSGTYTQFRLIQPQPTGSPPANGKIQKINFTGTDLTDLVSESNLCSLPPIDSNFYQSLTDTDTKNGVSVDLLNGESVFEQRGDSVIIKFTGSAGIKAGYAYDVTVQDGGVPFTTSVQVRGIKR